MNMAEFIKFAPIEVIISGAFFSQNGLRKLIKGLGKI
jgi:hypothetical protein